MQAGKLQPDDVHRIFLSTDEFYFKGGGSDAGYITELYRDILHRAPDSAGLSYWVSALSQRGRASVVDGMWLAPETYLGEAAVLYTTFLGRSGSASEVTYWAGIAQSTGLTRARNQMMTTSEYGTRAVNRFP